jgi:hypothetical protein
VEAAGLDGAAGQWVELASSRNRDASGARSDMDELLNDETLETDEQPEGISPPARGSSASGGMAQTAYGITIRMFGLNVQVDTSNATVFFTFLPPTLTVAVAVYAPGASMIGFDTVPSSL